MDGSDAVEQVRGSLLWCPLEQGGFWTAELGGVRWLFAFSSADSLAGFARSRGAADGEEWPYVTVFGWRLLTEVLPAIPGPAGLAVDLGSPRPLLLPPVAGIVPRRAVVA